MRDVIAGVLQMGPFELSKTNDMMQSFDMTHDLVSFREPEKVWFISLNQPRSSIGRRELSQERYLGVSSVVETVVKASNFGRTYARNPLSDILKYVKRLNGMNNL